MAQAIHKSHLLTVRVLISSSKTQESGFKSLSDEALLMADEMM